MNESFILKYIPQSEQVCNCTYVQNPTGLIRPGGNERSRERKEEDKRNSVRYREKTKIWDQHNFSCNVFQHGQNGDRSGGIKDVFVPTRQPSRCLCGEIKERAGFTGWQEVSEPGRDTGAECSGAEWISSGGDHTHGFTSPPPPPPPPPPLSRLSRSIPCHLIL